MSGLKFLDLLLAIIIGVGLALVLFLGLSS
jgi:hypothetical protein